VSEESGPLAPVDETTLEISTVGSAESGREEASTDLGTRDQYGQAAEELPVSSPAEYVNDGSGFDSETLAERLIGIMVDDEVIHVQGHWVEAVIIVKVIKNSPAARAGLRGGRGALGRLVEAGAVVGVVIFPPAATKCD
jgi:hypothetical protein